MPEPIEPLLHRRNDLSTFLVHLTKDSSGPGSARENLLEILDGRRIEARSVYGMAAHWAEDDAAVAATQRCVCFSEVPLEHVWMLSRDIEGRQVAMKPFGIVLTKSWGRLRGLNPVWYLDITPGHTWLTNPINTLVENAKADTQAAADELPILKLTPYIEQMGPMNNGAKKEFWWEREWRKAGHLHFLWSNLVAVLAPANEHTGLVKELAERRGEAEEWVEQRLRFLDPTWGLERMIAELAGVDEAHAGPLPRY